MGREFSLHGIREMYIGYWWKDLKDGDHWEDLNLDRRVILRWNLEK
jgi:hypothetical protein